MRPGTLILTGWLLGILVLPGCFVLQVGVTNPAPNLPRIAVAPFVNLSSERSVDGRRFAEAYYTELQKVPGFQVIPVGVVESALHDYGLNLDSPADMEKLIHILDVDGLCFGAVTEYNPYYPPRLGLQISWYTTKFPDFQPGLPLDPAAGKSWRDASGRGKRTLPREASWSDRFRCAIPGFPCAEGLGGPEMPSAQAFPALRIRAQNDEAPLDLPSLEPSPLTPDEQRDWDRALMQVMGIDAQLPPEEETDSALEKRRKLETLQQLLEVPSPFERAETDDGSEPALPGLPQTDQPNAPTPPESLIAPSSAPPRLPGENPYPENPFPQPYMSYTRVFDGADAEFTAALKNYLELSGDQRSGGWTGHLHRSEDFIRFCMRSMIVEMLQLHGGEAQRRFVMTSRKYQ
ncbi:MAG: hypothetical protein R3C12_01790 [Planctomycetaceae bacterium]|nr:hypothetical protein [Planctomycetaceae bacterium]